MDRSISKNLTVTYRAVVYPSQSDSMGHMTVQYYVAAFDQAMWHLVAELGYDPEWRQSQSRGWADVNYNIQFKNELKVGDLYLVKSAVKKIGNKSLTTFHEMQTVKGEVVADIEMISTYFNLTSRQAELIPEEIRLKCLEALGSRGSQ